MAEYRKELRKPWLAVLGSMLAAMALGAQEANIQADRSPAYAGSFYSGTAQGLHSQLEGLFDAALPVSLEGRPRCLIVPHAGYAYSGLVCASGYKSIPAGTAYRNIFIIASSHREQFRGASVFSVGDYLTPLGRARVNRDIASALIAHNKHISYVPEAHDREHAVEVQVPMIQHHFGHPDPPPIIPIVIGNASVEASRELATALLPYFTPENLFIISADFSHYPPYEDAVRIDRISGESVLKNDPGAFYKALRSAAADLADNLATPCCSWNSVLTLLYMSEHVPGLAMVPVLYRNSGDSPVGSKDQVVGYWAIAGVEAEKEMSDFTLSEAEKENLLTISRQTLDFFVRHGNIPEIQAENLPENLKQPAGAFVSLYKHGELRGCIGSFRPKDPLYKVVRDMTAAAASRDIRFFPVREGELDFITIELSVLSPLRKIESADEFELGHHGIYMVKDGKSGTYLPQVAESSGWKKEEFLGHCARDKAQIGWEGWKEADLYVYEALVFGQKKQK